MLARATRADARAIFRAIALAAPAGLGSRTVGDVRRPPRIGLIDAMRLAARRDLVARADAAKIPVPRLRTAYTHLKAYEKQRAS